MEQEYNAKLGVDMKKMLQKNLEEEQHEKKKYQAQCKKYQHELDLQLQSLRSRSLNNLTRMCLLIYLRYVCCWMVYITNGNTSL